MKKLWITVVMAAVLVLALCACQSPQQPGSTPGGSQGGTSTPQPGPSNPAPSTPAPSTPAGFRTPQAVQTGSGVTVKTAAEWAEQYPDIYASYQANSGNTTVHDYTKDYPMITTLYEGMAFAKFYNSARGHVYTIDDITATGRPHALANCFSCKTPDFTAMVNEKGDAAYTIPFEDALKDINEPVSCYNCHANTGSDLVVTHSYLTNAMGEDFGKVDARTLSCAQCHVEYYFDPASKATTLPYQNLETMSPDAILSYYNEDLLVDGQPFADYTNPRTGVRQIKVQHPEFETFMGAGSVHAGTFTCADCHMGQATAEDGSTYVSHTWTSPLQNQALLDGTCSVCHKDLAGDVKKIQDEIEGRTAEVGNKLVDLTEKLAAAVSGGKYTEDELNAIRTLARNAQFYWDFVFVENAEGAHNSALSRDCLNKAEQLADQALAMFK